MSASDPVQDDLWAFVSPPHKPVSTNVETGADRAEAGMDQAEFALDMRWRAAAQATIAQLAATQRPFTADDVRDRVGDPLGSPSGIGALFRAASRAGLISHCGWTTSTRPEAHCRPLRQWRGVL